jgi:hypothetical protein
MPLIHTARGFLKAAEVGDEDLVRKYLPDGISVCKGK